ncbi:hypothetical protein SA87_01720 [Hydrogenibacillus schlegelii]|uniref:MFS transporter n=1 Tax=Hydrogenibacillus schlegelii TaxID=1484 RepID=A0A179IMI4_HYDSH|nr:hypothetical protein SA87_01720 [Hydrogenibacillus schlegelii]
MVALLLAAANMRTGIASMGPLMAAFQAVWGVGAGAAGTLMTLPIVAFGFFSPLMPAVARRLGLSKALGGALVWLTLALALRPWDGYGAMAVGTLAAGVGMAALNVLLPAFIKARYPERMGTLTGLYTMMLNLAAALATGATASAALAWGWPWPLVLSLWSLPAGAAAFVWAAAFGRQDPTADERSADVGMAGERPVASGASLRSALRSPTAWAVTAFMGLQSFLFFSAAAWLPTMLGAEGVPEWAAGWWFSATQFIGIPANFLFPWVAVRLSRQRGLGALVGGLFVVGWGLYAALGARAVVPVVVALGAAQAAGISLALALIGLRSETAAGTAALSGMAQSVGYLIAAVGPVGVGALLDLAGRPAALSLLLVTSGLTVLAGFRAGAPVTMEAELGRAAERGRRAGEPGLR